MGTNRTDVLFIAFMDAWAMEQTNLDVRVNVNLSKSPNTR